MERNSSPVVTRRRLAAELKRAREGAGRTGGEIAKELDWSSSRISRIEKAQVGIPVEDVEALARVYGIGDPLRAALLQLASESMAKAWWDSYGDFLLESYVTFIGLEAGAEVERSWQTNVVPGLLQTPDYAAATMRLDALLGEVPPGVVRRRTEVRMRRQRLLTAEDPLRLECVIDEAVLGRLYGSREIVRDQLHHLRKMASLPNVAIRVLSNSTIRNSALTGFVLLQYSEGDDVLGKLHPDVIYEESVKDGSLEENESATFSYLRTYERFAEMALSEQESLALIGETADRLV